MKRKYTPVYYTDGHSDFKSSDYNFYKIAEYEMQEVDFSAADEHIIANILSQHKEILELNINDETIKRFKGEISTGLGTPYEFKKIIVGDFSFLKNKKAYLEWEANFPIHGCEECEAHTIKLYKQFIEACSTTLFERTDINNGIWKLSLDNIRDNNWELDSKRTHPKLRYEGYLHAYYDLFIEIDRNKELIRLMAIYDE